MGGRMHDRVCEVCETPYCSRGQRVCSIECRTLYLGGSMPLRTRLGRPLCLWCEEPFDVPENTSQSLLFCSRPCFQLFERACGNFEVVRDWLAVERAKRKAGVAEIKALERRLARLKEETWRIDVPKAVLVARRRARVQAAALRRLASEA